MAPFSHIKTIWIKRGVVHSLADIAQRISDACEEALQRAVDLKLEVVIDDDLSGTPGFVGFKITGTETKQAASDAKSRFTVVEICDIASDLSYFYSTGQPAELRAQIEAKWGAELPVLDDIVVEFEGNDKVEEKNGKASPSGSNGSNGSDGSDGWAHPEPGEKVEAGWRLHGHAVLPGSAVVDTVVERPEEWLRPLHSPHVWKDEQGGEWVSPEKGEIVQADWQQGFNGTWTGVDGSCVGNEIEHPRIWRRPRWAKVETGEKIEKGWQFSPDGGETFIPAIERDLGVEVVTAKSWRKPRSDKKTVQVPAPTAQSSGPGDGWEHPPVNARVEMNWEWQSPDGGWHKAQSPMTMMTMGEDSREYWRRPIRRSRLEAGLGWEFAKVGEAVSGSWMYRPSDTAEWMEVPTHLIHTRAIVHHHTRFRRLASGAWCEGLITEVIKHEWLEQRHGCWQPVDPKRIGQRVDQYFRYKKPNPTWPGWQVSSTASVVRSLSEEEFENPAIGEIISLGWFKRQYGSESGWIPVGLGETGKEVLQPRYWKKPRGAGWQTPNPYEEVTVQFQKWLDGNWHVISSAHSRLGHRLAPTEAAGWRRPKVSTPSEERWRTPEIGMIIQAGWLYSDLNQGWRSVMPTQIGKEILPETQRLFRRPTSDAVKVLTPYEEACFQALPHLDTNYEFVLPPTRAKIGMDTYSGAGSWKRIFGKADEFEILPSSVVPVRMRRGRKKEDGQAVPMPEGYVAPISSYQTISKEWIYYTGYGEEMGWAPVPDAMIGQVVHRYTSKGWRLAIPSEKMGTGMAPASTGVAPASTESASDRPALSPIPEAKIPFDFVARATASEGTGGMGERERIGESIPVAEMYAHGPTPADWDSCEG